MTRARSRRMRHRGEHGVAMVEAVIALPVFAILLWAVVWKGNQLAHQQALEREARLCVYRYALSGCGDKKGLPKRCADALSVDKPNKQTQEVLTEAGEDASAFEELGNIPVAGQVFKQVFGKEAVAVMTRETTRPAFLGGGKVKQVAAIRLLCNERPVKGDILKQLWAKWGL